MENYQRDQNGFEEILQFSPTSDDMRNLGVKSVLRGEIKHKDSEELWNEINLNEVKLEATYEQKRALLKENFDKIDETEKKRKDGQETNLSKYFSEYEKARQEADKLRHRGFTSRLSWYLIWAGSITLIATESVVTYLFSSSASANIKSQILTITQQTTSQLPEEYKWIIAGILGVILLLSIVAHFSPKKFSESENAFVRAIPFLDTPAWRAFPSITLIFGLTGTLLNSNASYLIITSRYLLGVGTAASVSGILFLLIYSLNTKSLGIAFRTKPRMREKDLKDATNDKENAEDTRQVAHGNTQSSEQAKAQNQNNNAGNNPHGTQSLFYRCSLKNFKDVDCKLLMFCMTVLFIGLLSMIVASLGHLLAVGFLAVFLLLSISILPIGIRQYSVFYHEFKQARLIDETRASIREIQKSIESNEVNRANSMSQLADTFDALKLAFYEGVKNGELLKKYYDL